MIIDSCQSFNERLQKQMEEGNAKGQHMKRSGRQASVVGACIYVDHGVCKSLASVGVEEERENEVDEML